MNKKWTTGLAVLACLAVTGVVWAQASSSYDNRWHVLSAGGSQDMASSNYTIHGTSGQFAIGPASGGQSGVGSGYWYGIRLYEDYEIYLPVVLRSS